MNTCSVCRNLDVLFIGIRTLKYVLYNHKDFSVRIPALITNNANNASHSPTGACAIIRHSSSLQSQVNASLLRFVVVVLLLQTLPAPIMIRLNLHTSSWPEQTIL
jgi:hypothetical protein